MKLVINNVTQDKVNKAMAGIQANGGTVNGNNFSVKGVEGSFSMNGAELTIFITKKPFLAPESLIESKLRAFFA